MFANPIPQEVPTNDSLVADNDETTAPPQKNIRVAIVDDDHREFFMMKYLLKQSHLMFDEIEHYQSLNDFLADSTPSPHVVLLDRHLPDSVLTEARIREVRARHADCGVIMHTGMMTPSLRSTAAHEGAIAVIEKGSLDSAAMSSLVRAAAMIGGQM